MHTFDMMITDLKMMLVVVGVITIIVFVYSKYLDRKLNKEIDKDEKM